MLELLDRLLPNIGRYPVWARALFGATILLVLASAGVYAALYNDATAKLQDSKVSIAITPAVATEADARNADELDDTPQQAGPFFARLTYADVRNGGGPHFVAQQDYLDAARAGGPVDALSGLSAPPWSAASSPPVLNVKVANNSDRTMQLTEAVLRVRRSVADRQPVLVPMVRIDRPRRLSVLNYGWGPAEDLELSGRVRLPGGGSGEATVQVGTVDGEASADLSEAFERAGLDLAALSAWEAQPDPSEDPAAYDRALQRANAALAAAGIAPDEPPVVVPVDGVLRHRGAAGEAAELAYSAELTPTMPTGLGDFQPPTARYAATRLEVQGADYERRVPLSQEVAPGGTDSFEIPLTAAASSLHQLSVQLLAGGEPAGAPHDLAVDILVPRDPGG